MTRLHLFAKSTGYTANTSPGLVDSLLSLPRSFILAGLAGSLSLVVYLVTIAPDLSWSNFSSDGAELISASVTMGIAHPPGYPTYILLGKLFSLLPLGTVAFRYNVFSAIAMASAVAFSTATTYASNPAAKSNWSAVLSAGLTFAFAPLIWSQATIAEVYALNLAVLSIFLWLLLSQRSSWLAGAMLGLSFTTHLTTLLMLPLGLALTPRGKRKHLGLGIIIGLLPLLTLPLLNRLGSPVIWGDPSTLNGWWWLISAQLYQANINVPTTTVGFLSHLSTWSATIFKQFAWAGWLFIIFGVFAHRLRPRRSTLLLLTAAFYAVFSLLYSPNDAIVNLLPAFLLLVPFLAAGFTRLKYWSLLFPLLLLLLNFSSQNLRAQQSPRPPIEKVLRIMPENAVVLTPGDHSIFSLWYFQHVEGQRTDLVLVDENLLAFMWYRQRLAVRYPGLEGLDTDDLAQFRQLNSKKRPICYLSLQNPQSLTCPETASANFN
mgnify:CR=1 FL=1